MTEDRVLPPKPEPSAAALLRKPSRATDFWAGLFLDLTVRVEWLAQALDAIPQKDTSAAALARLRDYARALEDLRVALQRVQGHRADPRVKPRFSLEGPLAAYLSRLYAWCDAIAADFERMAGALRRGQPTSIVFSHHAVNESYREFDALISAMRGVDGVEDAAARHDLELHLEELVWATEWLHMTLARPPGQ